MATPSPTINNIQAPSIQAPGAVASRWPAAKGRRCRCCTATPKQHVAWCSAAGKLAEQFAFALTGLRGDGDGSER